MTACQSSERVPNADRAFLGPSADSCPQKFERSRAPLPAIACFRTPGPNLGCPELPRFLQQFLRWSLASGSWGRGANRESKQAQNAIVKHREA